MGKSISFGQATLYGSEFYGETFSDFYGCNMQQGIYLFKANKDNTERKVNLRDWVKTGSFIYHLILCPSPVL